MAYGLLANGPAIIGLYVAVFPVLIYCLMGTSHHNSMGILNKKHILIARENN